MKKCWIIGLGILGLSACTVKDRVYYQSHPHELQQALQQCASQPSQIAQCRELSLLGQELNALAYQLQKSPQQFGNQILALQERIAEQEKVLQTKKESQLQKELQDNQQQLALYMSVVKWLESPMS